MTEPLDRPDELFRDPSPLEWSLISRLLKPNFPGRDEIQKILNSVQVRTLDEEGSLELHSDVPGIVSGAKAIPVEAEANDSDGVPIHVLLHVVHGRPNELEIYKDDSSTIQQMPPAAAFEAVVLPPAPWEKQ